MARYGEAAAIARRSGNDVSLLKAIVNDANLRVLLGALDDVGGMVLQARRLAGAVGNPFLSAYVDLLRAELHHLHHEHTTARELASAAAEAFERLGSVREANECKLMAARSLLAARRYDELELRLRDLRQAGAELGSAHLSLWTEALDASMREDCIGWDPRAACARLEAVLGTAKGDERPADMWRIHLHLARARQACRNQAEAALHAREAQRLLESISDPLGDELRASFRVLPEHRTAFLEIERLATPAQGSEDEAGFLRQVLELNKRLSAAEDHDSLLRTILDVAIALTGAERGFVLTTADTAQIDALWPRVARNFDRETLRHKEVKFSSGVAREVLVTGRALLSVDASADTRLEAHASVHAMQLRSVLCVPMVHRALPLGVVYLDNRFQRGAFEPRHLAFLEAFADQAAMTLARADLLDRERRARLGAEQTAAELSAARSEVERLNGELRRELEARAAVIEATQQQLVEQEDALRQRYRYDSIIGRSAGMKRIFDVLDRVAPRNVPVLITGESGTGKELVARALHHNSPRCRSRLVSINCAALPDSLLESELFGHVRGAFTGADRDRPGLFEQAHGGSLFLDEVGDMSLAMQSKVLRAIETGEVRRVGAARTLQVDVRIVAATHCDLGLMVADGRFRKDLYYRLKVVELRIPPMRERREDVPLLIEHFLRQVADESGEPLRQLSPPALRALRSYDWPGNVRELQSAVTSAAVLGDSRVLRPEDFPMVPGEGSRGTTGLAWDGASTLGEMEGQLVRSAYERLGRNKSRTARALGIDRNTLHVKLRKLDGK